MIHETAITKSTTDRKLNVIREFSAPIDKVWKAWTESSILDKWWAPRPWKAETKSLDFRAGGTWQYCMVGPKGERQWCLVDFETVDPKRSFRAVSGFCDEQGTRNDGIPLMHWFVRFEPSGSGSKIIVTVSFDNAGDLEKVVEMGFEQGFTMGLGNLDEIL
jgi:uncharacterized protein YndB with AHSA1/START domain